MREVFHPSLPTAAPPAAVPGAAGGWLARAFIGQQQYKGPPELLVSADTLGSGDLEPNPAVRSLVTLGTPHTPPPPDKVRAAHAALGAGLGCGCSSVGWRAADTGMTAARHLVAARWAAPELLIAVGTCPGCSPLPQLMPPIPPHPIRNSHTSSTLPTKLRLQVRDMTGGALTWVNATWPGAAFAGQGVRYVCAGGRAVRGNSEADRQTVPGYAHGSYQQVGGGVGWRGPCGGLQVSQLLLSGVQALGRGAHCTSWCLSTATNTAVPAPLLSSPHCVTHSPEGSCSVLGACAPQVCGEGHGVEGDAVVPLQSALLEGAEHVVLDGVFHRHVSFLVCWNWELSFAALRCRFSCFGPTASQARVLLLHPPT